MQPEIVLDRKLAGLLNPEQRAKLIEDADSMRDMMGTTYFPCPPTEEDRALYGDTQVASIMWTPEGLKQMVMMLPIFLRNEDRHIYYLQLKIDKIVLEINYEVKPGHHKT